MISFDGFHISSVSPWSKFIVNKSFEKLAEHERWILSIGLPNQQPNIQSEPLRMFSSRLIISSDISILLITPQVGAGSPERSAGLAVPAKRQPCLVIGYH